MKEYVLSRSTAPEDLRIDYENELNEEQLRVVQNGGGPTLVLAGAGSGKTRTITYRVAWLLEHGVPPQSILLLTFTNKAAREMVGRVEALLGTYPQGLWGGTFHSIANRILRRNADLVGFAPNFSILDQEDAKDLVGLCVKELKIDTKGRRFPSAKVLQALLSYRSNRGCSMEQAVEEKHPKFLPILPEIEEVSRLYPQIKKQQNVMDFDDLLLKLLELLRDQPDVAARLSRQFEYILVDEFQDTNVIQAEIVHLLAKTHQNLLVVGDDAQSIYSFRAAEIRNILHFPDQYTSAQTFHLTTNYRSTPEILSVANEVINQNSSQFEKHLHAVNSPGERPNIVPAATKTQEARYIAEQMLDIHNAGTDLSEIAVLFRAAFHSQSLEFELMKRDIPYEYRGGLRFFERAHVKDIVAHLRVVENIKDTMAWVRMLKIHPGIGIVTATKIARMAAGAGDLDAVEALPITGNRAQDGWAVFLRIWRDVRSAGREPAQLVRAVPANEEYKLYLENEYPNFRERLDDLEQFAVFAEQFDDIRSFLEAVSLTNEYGAVRERGAQEDEDRVILSTIHQAKGLEWDHVFVMNMVEGGFPHKRAYDEDGGIEEERRLFYVAATRARRRLFFTYPTTAGYDTLEIQQPSMFLDEVPKEAVESVKLRSRYGSRYGHTEKAGNHGSAKRTDSWGDGEPTIVLDEYGERVKKQPPGSFLRDVGDL